MSRSICHELHGGDDGRQQRWKHDVGYVCNVVKYPLWLNQAVDVLTSSSSTESDIELACLLYTSPSPRDGLLSRMPSSA